MMREIRKKLKSRAGESIGETLVALLISAMALLMLAGAVSSGMSVVTRSNAVLKSYYEINNKVVEGEKKDSETDPDTFTTGEATISMSDPSLTGMTDSILTADGTAKKVYYWENDTLSNVPVVAYSVSPRLSVSGG